MDPISLALTILIKNSSGAASVAQAFTSPGKVDVEKMQGNLIDLSRGVLTCYHKTARFRQVDVVKVPWERQAQYGAENSMVLRVSYNGMTMMPYQMDVGVLAKGNSIRTAVISDSATIPYSKKCSLEEWSAPR